jgi:hypothetical protein
MALLFMDGFDSCNLSNKWYSTNYWGSSSIVSSGRNSSKCLQHRVDGRSDAFYYYACDTCYFSEIKTIIIGFAFYVPSTMQQRYVFYYGDNIQCAVQMDTGNNWSFRVGNSFTQLGSSFSVDNYSVWNYIEMKITVDDSVGAYEIRVNGVTKISGSNVDTRGYSGTDKINQFRLFTYSHPWSTTNSYYDDLYILDNSGSINNDFLGDCRVDVIKPNGAGTTTQWTPSTGANYECVNEVPESGTDYVYTSTLDNIDLYSLEDLPVGANGEIFGIMINHWEKRAEVGVPTRTAPLYRIGGTTYELTDRDLGSSYTYDKEVIELNPDTGVQWIDDDINSLEVGIKLTDVTL